jgi:hypothetical protein
MSPTVCSRYHAFPLSLADRVLTVAMVEPHRLDLVDELAFSLGYAIRPAVAPEFQIHYHMAKRYGLLLEHAQQQAPAGMAGAYAPQQPPPGMTGPYPAQPPPVVTSPYTSPAQPPAAAGPYPPQGPSAGGGMPPVSPGPTPGMQAPAQQPPWPPPPEPPSRGQALSFQVNDQVLKEHIRGLPRMVLDMLPLFRQGLPLTEIFGRMDLSPERGMAVVKRLMDLGILQ